MRKDPYEIYNLAGDPDHQAILREMRFRLDRWMQETSDPGPESMEVYEANVTGELANPANRGHRDTVLENAALMKRWAGEGK